MLFVFLAALLVVPAEPKPVDPGFSPDALIHWRGPVHHILATRTEAPRAHATLTVRRNGRWTVQQDSMRPRVGQMSPRQSAWLVKRLLDDRAMASVDCAGLVIKDEAIVVVRPKPHGPCWMGPRDTPVALPPGNDPLRDSEQAPHRYLDESDLAADMLVSWHDAQTGRRLDIAADGRLKRYATSGKDQTLTPVDKGRAILSQTELQALSRLIARATFTTRRDTTARKCLITTRWSRIAVRRRDKVQGTTWDQCLENASPSLRKLGAHLSELYE